MSDELRTRLKEIFIDVIGHAEGYKLNNDMSVLCSGDLNDWFLPEAIAQINKAYKEEGNWPLDSPVAKEYYRHVFEQEGLVERESYRSSSC
jgi:hypothetical protein